MSTQNNEMIDLLFGEASDVIFDRENNKFDLLAFLRLYLAHHFVLWDWKKRNNLYHHN